MSTFINVGVKTNKNKDEISIFRFGPERAPSRADYKVKHRKTHSLLSAYITYHCNFMLAI
jgi:hypothetical protein